MSNITPLLRISPQSLTMWCPGCDDSHRISLGPNGWTWDGSEDAPSISPSILVQAVQWDESKSFHRPNHRVAPGERTICHSFIRGGVWEFLGDCTHIHVGQHIPMVPFPAGRLD